MRTIRYTMIIISLIFMFLSIGCLANSAREAEHVSAGWALIVSILGFNFFMSPLINGKDDYDDF